MRPAQVRVRRLINGGDPAVLRGRFQGVASREIVRARRGVWQKYRFSWKCSSMYEVRLEGGMMLRYSAKAHALRSLRAPIGGGGVDYHLHFEAT